MKKKKTLPQNFGELLKKGNVEELKKVFDKCELTAYERGALKSTALHFYDVPYDFMKWILEQGYDPNTMNLYDVPLRYNFNDIEKIKLLLEHGADINFHCYDGNTPLHYLCDSHASIETLKFFLQNGADTNARNDDDETPLIYAIKRHESADTRFLQMIEIMQDSLSDDERLIAKEEIKRIGKIHEFYKTSWDDENFRNERNANMKKLYEIFDVEPIPERKIASENTTIKVSSNDWQKQYNELWNLLVPGCARAEFLQGEAIRLIGKLSYEVLDMGCCNWDEDFAQLSKAYKLIISYGKQLEKEDYNKVILFVDRIKSMGEAEFAFVAKKTVEWILMNPNPVKLSDFNNPEYARLKYRR